MLLLGLLKANPTAGVAVLLTAGTMLFCVHLLRGHHSSKDRLSIALIGMIALFQGLRILGDMGFWGTPVRSTSGIVEAAVGAMYLLTARIVKLSSRDRHAASIHLRVVEANPLPIPVWPKSETPERSALAIFGVNERGTIDLWHSSAEEFFGWRSEEVLGSRVPFAQSAPANGDSSSLPRILKLKTKRNQHLEALVWLMPVPGETSTLVLVMDYRNVKRSDCREAAVALLENG